MRLTSSGLPQSRSQACLFARFLRASAFENDQPIRKRCRLHYSTDNNSNGGRKDATAHLARGGNAPTAQLSPDDANELRRQSPPGSIHIRKTRVGPGPTLRLSAMPRTVERQLGKWKLSVQQLEIESDVGHSRDIGTKLVDDAELARDFNLWKELLLYRQRHYGGSGTRDIWKGMRERCGGVDLPVAGDNAHFFWGSFVAAGLKRGRFLAELKDYAQDLWERRRQKWHPFYGAVVGGYLEMGSVRKALRWHWILRDIHLSRPNDILRIFRQAMSSKNGLKAFRSICRTVEGHKIYGEVIPMLWQRHMVDDALNMHHMLVPRNDGPHNIEQIEPLFRHLRDFVSREQGLIFVQGMVESGIAHKGQWLKLVRHGTTKTCKGEPGQNTTGKRPDNKAAPHGTNPQTKFTDDFGARLFATKAFSFELILSGMEMFSVQTIGPLTLRQMALRAKDASGVAQQFEALQKFGIALDSSVYSRVVQKLVAQKDSRTLSDVLHSDQHPDVLEDLTTQEVLLSSYTLSRDWRQANMTMTVLSVLSDEDPYNLNVQFRNLVNTGRWSATTEVIERMKERGVVLSERSVKRMSRMALPLRRPGRRPQPKEAWFLALWHLLGTLQYVAKCGGRVFPGVWKEGLKRLGMAGRWTHLETLCFWLAHFYSTSRITHPDATDVAGFQTRSGRPNQLVAAQKRSAFETIFSLPLQQGIIAWGFSLPPAVLYKGQPFLNPFSNNGEALIPWVRGITLLRQLKEKGVVVHQSAVRKACRQRLAVLYGRYRRSSRKKNRALRRENPYMLEELLRDMDKAWGKPLFADFTGKRYELVNPPARKTKPRVVL